MSGNKKIYDLIVSLGGNCSAAHNLRMRGLRLFSYPFDWTYFKEDEAVYKLADGFKNQFQDILLKENLVELPINPSHPEYVQYKEKNYKIVWANHFHKKVSDRAEYNKVRNIMMKRCSRLLEHIKMSQKILFIFSTMFEINSEPFDYLMNQLKSLYPHKEFEITVVSFSCPKEETISHDGITLYKFTRNMNNYDFIQTNYEWHFLDDLDLSPLFLPKANFFTRFIIKNFPFKEIRKELRRKYHV